MNKIVTVGLIGLGIYALSAAKKASGATKLEFYTDSVDFSGITLTDWTFIVKIEVVNPTKASQRINALFGSVYAGSKQIARIQNTVGFNISKQDSTFIDVPVKLTPDGAGYVLAKIIQGNIPPITVKGTVDTMGFNIPFENQLY